MTITGQSSLNKDELEKLKKLEEDLAELEVERKKLHEKELEIRRSALVQAKEADKDAAPSPGASGGDAKAKQGEAPK